MKSLYDGKPFKLTKKDRAEIDASVARMLKENSVVGRWCREHFPNQFESILKRARIESKERNDEMRRNVIIKVKGRH